MCGYVDMPPSVTTRDLGSDGRLNSSLTSSTVHWAALLSSDCTYINEQLLSPLQGQIWSR